MPPPGLRQEHPLEDDLILLTDALYGPGGLYPAIRRHEVREKVGPVIKRRIRRGSGKANFLRRSDVEAAKSLIS